MDLLREVENWAAPFVLVMTGGAARVGRVGRRTASGRCSRSRASSDTLGEFWPVFVPSLTAMIGFWATLSLNMPDFTRFGRSQREQIVGQVVALPTTMSLFAAMGVMITSATAIIYGEAIWDPVQLVGQFSIAGRRRDLDVHGRGRDARGQHRGQRRVAGQRLRQRVSRAAISFKTGGLITGMLGIVDAAVEAARRSVRLHLHLAARLLGRPRLDRRRADRRLLDRAETRAAARGSLPAGRRYRYTRLELPGVGATLVGCALAWGGLVVPALKPLYDYAWFVGFAVSCAVYLALAKRA